MPRKTDCEKIDELEKTVAALLEHSKASDDQIARLSGELKQAQQNERVALQTLNDFRREHDREVVLLNRELEEQRKWAEKNGTSELKAELAHLKDKFAKLEAAHERIGNRAWSVVPNVFGALVSGTIAALVAYFVARR